MFFKDYCKNDFQLTDSICSFFFLNFGSTQKLFNIPYQTTLISLRTLLRSSKFGASVFNDVSVENNTTSSILT